MSKKQYALSVALICSYLILGCMGYRSHSLVINGQLPETGIRSSLYYLFWFIGAFSGWLYLSKLESSIQKYLIFFICLLSFLCPPWSQDVFNYVASSRTLVVYKLNPYLFPLNYISPNDPFLGASVWDKHVTPYGPTLTFLQAPIAYASIFASKYFQSLGREAILIPVYAFKLMLLGFHIANIYLISKISEALKRSTEQKKVAIWLYAANPLILYESIATGHNDLIIAFLLLFSFFLFLKNKKVFSVLLSLLAFLGKYTSGIFLATHLAYCIVKKDFKYLTSLILLSSLVIINTYLWIDSMPPYKIFLMAVGEISWGSIPHYLSEYLLKNVIKETTIFNFFYALGCLSSLVIAYNLLKKDKHLEAFTTPLFIFCLFTTPVHNNWYMILPLSFAALLEKGILRNSIFILAICSQFTLLQFIIYIFDIWPHPETQIGLTFIPCILYLMIKTLKSDKS